MLVTGISGLVRARLRVGRSGLRLGSSRNLRACSALPREASPGMSDLSFIGVRAIVVAGH